MSKYIVKVVIEKEIEIELMPSMFLGKSEKEYLEEFRKDLWDVATIEDVAMYAAKCAFDSRKDEHYDGIGLLAVARDDNLIPDVKYRELMVDWEAEILKRY